MVKAHRVRFDAWIAKWLAGEPVTGKYADEKIRRFLLEKYGGCQQCGWNKIHPITGLIPVNLHHIDGDHFNNSPDNVLLLCPCCHSLTPNYCALNKKKKLAGAEGFEPPSSVLETDSFAS